MAWAQFVCANRGSARDEKVYDKLRFRYGEIWITQCGSLMVLTGRKLRIGDSGALASDNFVAFRLYFQNAELNFCPGFVVIVE